MRPRPPAQSSCPLDAWRTLREPWRRYRHQVTTTEEWVRLAGGVWLSPDLLQDGFTYPTPFLCPGRDVCCSRRSSSRRGEKHRGSREPWASCLFDPTPDAPWLSQRRKRPEPVGCIYSIFLQIGRIPYAAEFVYPTPKTTLDSDPLAAAAPALRLRLLGEAFSDRVLRVRPQLPALLFCSSPQSSGRRVEGSAWAQRV